MGVKIKNAKFMKKVPIGDIMPLRRQAKPTGLYLLELRTRAAQAQAPLPKKKLLITIDPRNIHEGRPQPIKIKHA
jgi:hypothetical protein